MRTIPPTQAEHQLTQVANRFDEWRQTRPTRAEPIPQHLWEQAMALTALLPITYVARRCIGIPNALFATAALQGDASRMFPPHSLVNFLLVY